VQKPGKKEKIRFGQAPRETLPAAATPTTETQEGAQTATATDAGAAGTEAQLARNVAPDISTNADVPAPAAAPTVKTRFADRARQPKPKKVKSPDQIENENVEKVPADETAAQKTQSAPLGLGGDTLHPKKQPKPKGEKTRYSDATGQKPEPPPPAAPSTPSPLAAPGTAPQESAPAATPDSAPAATPPQSAPPAGQPAPTQQ
jgi:peptidyl-prolyl cis-trans isomerase SurA